jgi:carbon starvation protein
MKLGTIFALALGIFFVLPNLQMPAVSRFVDGSGPVVAGKIFPFCFITIACGAISGFHTLIASGTTPKMLTRESFARPIGYGAMCLESLVAIMALIAACTLQPGVYLSMNSKGDPVAICAKATALGFTVTPEQMNGLATELGEQTLFGRTGGAATLAVGMASIFSRVVNGRWLDLWYHFAIMFEALFILTTIDAGTRVGRYLVQDALGHFWQPLGRTRNLGPNVLASVLVVGAWGYFLVQGVRDPFGGINSLWPLFGIANQMLAGIALCLVTTVTLKTQLARPLSSPAPPGKPGRPALALITFVPLVWLLTVTLTAGVEKIWHRDPRLGFLAQAKALAQETPNLEENLARANSARDASLIQAASEALRTNRMQRFNQRLDAAVAGLFLLLMSAIVILSAREWLMLLRGRKPAVLHESPPSWLPDFALAEAKPLRVAGLLGLGFVLAKELSGEGQLERASEAAICNKVSAGTHARFAAGATTKGVQQDTYLENLRARYSQVSRCC